MLSQTQNCEPNICPPICMYTRECVEGEMGRGVLSALGCPELETEEQAANVDVKRVCQLYSSV